MSVNKISMSLSGHHHIKSSKKCENKMRKQIYRLGKRDMETKGGS